MERRQLHDETFGFILAFPDYHSTPLKILTFHFCVYPHLLAASLLCSGWRNPGVAQVGDALHRLFEVC